MKTKTYYYVIGLLLIGIVGVLAFQEKSIQPQDINTQIMVDTGTVITTGIIDSGSLLTGNQEKSLIYTNTEYGFQFTLPKGWEDYRVFVYNKTDNLPAGIAIALPTTMPGYKGVMDPSNSNNFSSSNTGSYTYIKGYAAMFDLMILDKNTYQTEYKKCQKDQRPGCINDGNTRGHNNKNYFIISGPQALTTDLDKQWGDRTYFDKIYKTFKVL